MVRRVVWAENARDDLREIHDYIARDSAWYAQTQVQRIQDTAARTRRHPRIGPPVPEFPKEPWRELLAGNWRVIYRLNGDETEVRILAVVHVRRLLKRSLVV